jgi:alpha/beta superfamily hydrolase
MSLQDSTEIEKVDVFSEHVFIPSDRGHLEGWLSYDADGCSCDGILLLSPHPSFAGTMENNVVKELAAVFSASGFAVLRFNYPGIGASSIDAPGSISPLDFWNTVEKEQRFDEALRPAMTALDFLKLSLGEFLRGVHLVGYSYGAMIALMMVLKVSGIRSVSAVSLPWISRYRYDFLSGIHCEKLFVTGREDFAFEPEVYANAWPKVAEPKVIQWLDCDHFFRKHEAELAREVCGFLLEVSDENV